MLNQMASGVVDIGKAKKTITSICSLLWLTSRKIGTSETIEIHYEGFSLTDQLPPLPVICSSTHQNFARHPCEKTQGRSLTVDLRIYRLWQNDDYKPTGPRFKYAIPMVSAKRPGRFSISGQSYVHSKETERSLQPVQTSLWFLMTYGLVMQILPALS